MKLLKSWRSKSRAEYRGSNVYCDILRYLEKYCDILQYFYNIKSPYGYFSYLNFPFKNLFFNLKMSWWYIWQSFYNIRSQSYMHKYTVEKKVHPVVLSYMYQCDNSSGISTDTHGQTVQKVTRKLKMTPRCCTFKQS